jgi:hypothetical protein
MATPFHPLEISPQAAQRTLSNPNIATNFEGRVRSDHTAGAGNPVDGGDLFFRQRHGISSEAHDISHARRLHDGQRALRIETAKNVGREKRQPPDTHGLRIRVNPAVAALVKREKLLVPLPLQRQGNAFFVTRLDPKGVAGKGTLGRVPQ